MGIVEICGRRIKKIEIRRKLIKEKACQFARSSNIGWLNCSFEGNNVIKDKVNLWHCSVGYATYISSNSKFGYTDIGRYCSIGPNVHIVAGRHPSRKFVSTFPAFFSAIKQAGFTYTEKTKFDEHVYVDKDNRVLAKIGSDVWIGDSASIMEGVTIADGTIIAAGAVVVRDTEPYSIWGGVPARLIRYRFEKRDINFLMELQWWNMSIDWIEEHAQYFDDVESLRHVMKWED